MFKIWHLSFGIKNVIKQDFLEPAILWSVLVTYTTQEILLFQHL